jgi:hypothetical protein
MEILQLVWKLDFPTISNEDPYYYHISIAVTVLKLIL